MDDEDDRQLLDILGDVDALNDYLHGSNSKSIGEEDVNNAAYGSDSSFFSSDTPVSNSGLKDVSDLASSLPLSGSLSFMEDELESSQSPPGGDDQPFDILQKSLMEADITEQTLAQEALLEGQPGLLQSGLSSTSFPSLSGHFIQSVPQLQNGGAANPQIQVLGSFSSGAGVVTLSNLERTPQQLLLRPPLANAQGQVSGFKNIPLQNIIIQRGPGGTQALVRPIQPKPVYSVANMANANGSIAVQSSLEQANVVANATTPGQQQFILPGSLALNGATDANANTLMSTQNTVQIVGQSFTATASGQLILNQAVAAPAPVASSAPGRLTLVSGQAHVSGSPVQRLLVTQTANCTSLSPLPQPQEQVQRPAPLTRGGMVLEQVHTHHRGVLSPDASRFRSFQDVLHRLLPYNVFQGSQGSELTQVDEEFELVSSQVVNKTDVMVDKYRRLLLVEAERASPSSEIVMIDRTFNQEERSALTQDKRTVLLDPDGFLDDFCCGVRSSLFSPPPPPPPLSPPSGPTSYFSDSPASPCSSGSALRTDPVQPPYSDPGGGGGGGGAGGEPHRPHRNELKLKFQTSAFAAGRYVSATHSDTDSALEAAVNSILEC